MRKSTVVATAALAVLALAAAAPASAQVDITSGPVVVDTTTAGQATVSVDVTNTGTIRIKVDLNVIALGNCSGDVFACDAWNCDRNGIAGVEGVNLKPGETTTLTVVIPLAAGDYLFRARTTGAKGGNEDQTFGVKPATVL